MRTMTLIAIKFAIILAALHPAHAADIAGPWTKTTHPDPDNIIVFFTEADTIKAVGYEKVGNTPAFWYGEGASDNGEVKITYRYSEDGTPSGWDPKGSMALTLSEDGRTLSGIATSESGIWSDRIEFRRISVSMRQ